jgi:hypothetical protein
MGGLPELTPHLVGGHEESGRDSKLQFKDDLAQSNTNLPERGRSQIIRQRESLVLYNHSILRTLGGESAVVQFLMEGKDRCPTPTAMVNKAVGRCTNH